MVLGLVAALEAVVIVLLVVARTPDTERAPSERVESPGSGQPEIPLAATRAPEGAPREGRAPTGPGPETANAPQPLAAPPTDTAAVGILLCGTVTVSDGGTLENATVEVDKAVGESDVPVHAGTYSIAGLAPGPYTLSVHARGCVSRPVQVALDASRPIERLDLRVDRAPSIPVRIRTPDGQPLLALFDQAQLPERMYPVATQQAVAHELAEDQAFPMQTWTEFSKLKDGEDAAELQAADWDGMLDVSVPLPLFVNLVWGRRVLDSQVVTAAGVSVSFSVSLDSLFAELSSVRVRVLDAESDRPLDGVLAHLDDDAFLEGDSTGVFSFDKVPPGPHVLRIHPPGSWMGLSGSLVLAGADDATHEELIIPLDTLAGKPLDLGDLRVQRTVAVRGRVTDGGGRPLALDVIAIRMDTSSDLPSRSNRLVVRANGNDGSFALRVVPGRWSFATSQDSEAPGAKILDIHGDIERLDLIGVDRPVQ